jgi:hypothetical protein
LGLRKSAKERKERDAEDRVNVVWGDATGVASAGTRREVEVPASGLNLQTTSRPAQDLWNLRKNVEPAQDWGAEMN